MRRAALLAVVALLAAAGCGDVEEPPAAPLDAERQSVLAFWEHFRRATSLRTEGDAGAAIGEYREALALNPVHEDSLYYLGQLQHETGDREDRDAYQRLIEVNADSSRGHVALATLLTVAVAGEGLDLAGAERHLRRAHEINTEETGPLVRLGEVLIARGEHAEAREWLDAAARTNPRSVEAAFLAGYLRWEAGEREEAAEFLGRAWQATQREVPVAGVLGEGDVRPGDGAVSATSSNVGRTMFGDLCEQLQAREDGEGFTAVEMDAMFGRVRGTEPGAPVSLEVVS